MSKPLVVLALCLLVGGEVATAQQPRLRPVTWSLSTSDRQSATDTGVFMVAELHARIDSRWHLYSLTQPPGGPRATVIRIVSDPPFRLAGAIGRPAPDTIPESTSTGVSEIYSDSVTFRLPIGLRSRPPGGTTPLVVAVTYQVCSATLCLAPRTDSVAVNASVVR